MTDLAINLSGVGKKYRFFSLDNIHLKVPQGQIMGLIGPNGAGKSTTIRILMGLVHQDSGDVRVLGHRMPAEQVSALQSDPDHVMPIQHLFNIAHTLERIGDRVNNVAEDIIFLDTGQVVELD